MYCPFCRAEYRPGFEKCADCGVALVEDLPLFPDDPNFMVLLWTGNDLSFCTGLYEALEAAQVPFAAPPPEVFLRVNANFHFISVLPDFRYGVGVYKRDFQNARKILEAFAREKFPNEKIPGPTAYPEPAISKEVRIELAQRRPSSDFSSLLVSASETAQLEFVKDSLRGVDIPWKQIVDNGVSTVFVLPEDETAARELLRQITLGQPGELDLVRQEDALLNDEPVQSYFLAWFLPLIFYGLWVLVLGTSLDSRVNSDSMFPEVFALVNFSVAVGTFWMMYQAVRYEVKPFRYCVAALFPLTFIWYYFERYEKRQGIRKLPISARLRMPPSA